MNNNPENIRIETATRLAIARERHPELHAAEAHAQLDLAGAIIAMDEVLGQSAALNEQAAVEEAVQRHLYALADLIRGRADSCF